MANLLVAMPIDIDLATVVPSQAAGDNVGRNLQVIQPGDIWRSNNLTSVNIVVTLQSALAIRFIWLGYTNLTSAATWQIRGATSISNLTAAPGYNSGSITFCPASDQDTYDFVNGLHVPATAQTYQFWRIDLTDAANSDLYMQAGRLYISVPFIPSRNLVYGWGGGVGDPSPIDKGESGASFPKRRSRAKALQVTFQPEEADAWDEMNKIDRLRGTSRDVIMCIDYENDNRILDWTVYGLFRQPRLITNPRFELYEKTWTLEELLP